MESICADGVWLCVCVCVCVYTKVPNKHGPAVASICSATYKNQLTYIVRMMYRATTTLMIHLLNYDAKAMCVCVWVCVCKKSKASRRSWKWDDKTIVRKNNSETKQQAETYTQQTFKVINNEKIKLLSHFHTIANWKFLPPIFIRRRIWKQWKEKGKKVFSHMNY